jgi:hypothetical protein
MSAKEIKFIDKNNRLVMTRLGNIAEQGNRSFDVEFWQRLTDEQRLNAVWELVVLNNELTGKDGDELRLQRTVENLCTQEG